MSNKKPVTTFADRPNDRNYNGRPKMSKEQKALRKASANEIIESYGRVLGMTAKEADIYKDSDECTITEKALILNMQRGRIEVVVDRVIGAIPKTVEINDKTNPERLNLEGKTEEEKKSILLQKLNSLKQNDN